MLKRFKLITSVILVTVSTFGAVAQTETYKSVVLDGKSAKLNLKTGDITYNNGKIAKSLAARKIKDSVIASNTVIKKNLITFESKSDTIKTAKEVKLTQINNNNNNNNTVESESPDIIYINKPDTLVDYYKDKKVIVATDKVYAVQNEFISTVDTTNIKEAIKITESELLKIKEKAIFNVYEVSKPVTNSDNTSNFHKVLKGETLYIISQRYHTSLGTLKKANNLETTLVKIGQILRIKNFEVYNFKQTSDYWTVSKGDTLYSIAKKNNTTVASLKSLNGLVSNFIIIGQTLQLK